MNVKNKCLKLIVQHLKSLLFVTQIPCQYRSLICNHVQKWITGYAPLLHVFVTVIMFLLFTGLLLKFMCSGLSVL